MKYIKTIRRVLSIPLVIVAGGFVTIAEFVGGYYIEFDISEINSD